MQKRVKNRRNGSELSGFWRAQQRKLLAGRQLRILLFPAGRLRQGNFSGFQRQNAHRHAGAGAAVRGLGALRLMLAVLYAALRGGVCAVMRIAVRGGAASTGCGMRGGSVFVMSGEGMGGRWQGKSQRQEHRACRAHPDQLKYLCQSPHTAISREGSGPRQDGNHASGAQFCVRHRMKPRTYEPSCAGSCAAGKCFCGACSCRSRIRPAPATAFAAPGKLRRGRMQ